MRLEESAQQIADTAMDAIAKADEQALDLEVLAVMFVVVIQDDEGKPRPVIATWTDPDA